MTEAEYDNFLDGVESAADDKLLANGFSLHVLAESELLAVLRRSFQWEVNNGGLPIFFYNSSGDNAVETAEALQLIGAEQAARILRDAIELFGTDGPSVDGLTRRNQLESMSEERKERFEDLSTAYFRLEHEGLSTSHLLVDYLQKQQTSAE